MAYKTFTVRSLGNSWTPAGNQLTLSGKIYDTNAKTFKNKEFLILGTEDTCSMTKFPEYMYVKTDSETLDKISNGFSRKDAYEHFEVCLEGKGTKNLRVAYFKSHVV